MRRKRRKRRGRNEGAIYQRAGGQWVGSVSLGYDASGKRKRKTVYGQSKAEVQEKLRRLQAAASSGQINDAGRLTLAEYLPRWLEAKKPTVATHTYLPYERDCNLYLIPYLGGVQLAKLAALHVEQLYADLTRDGVSASMQRKAGTTLRVALQHAVYPLKLIPHNPASDVPKPRHRPDEMTALDPDQVGRLLAAARSDRLYALYVVALDSAAREGELFALSWSEVDWDGSAISITKTLEETKGKLLLKDVKTAKSRRRVTLSAFAMNALAEHRKAMLAEGNYRPEAPVFCDTEGGWLRKSNVLRRSFRPILARAKLPPIRPYDLRHSGATLLLLAGEDSKIVSERLGHSSTRLTQDTYQHVLPGMQERAAAKLDAILTNGYKLATEEGKQTQMPGKGDAESATG
jgi:integrase